MTAGTTRKPAQPSNSPEPRFIDAWIKAQENSTAPLVYTLSIDQRVHERRPTSGSPACTRILEDPASPGAPGKTVRVAVSVVHAAAGRLGPPAASAAPLSSPPDSPLRGSLPPPPGHAPLPRAARMRSRAGASPLPVAGALSPRTNAASGAPSRVVPKSTPRAVDPRCQPSRPFGRSFAF